MDYKQENEQIKQRVENLFHQAKRKYGSWVKVAEKLETSYSSVARCRRNLKNYAFPSLPLYFRLCKLVEGQDCLEDTPDRFFVNNISDWSRQYFSKFQLAKRICV